MQQIDNPITCPELPLINTGKVRNTHAPTGDPDQLVIVATDRVSAFDVVMNIMVPGKGAILTTMTKNWIHLLEDLGCLLPWGALPEEDACHHHMITCDPMALTRYPLQQEESAYLADRFMLVRRAEHVLPIEFVVRGYLTGTGWKAYKQGKPVSGHNLPQGILECGKLTPTIFAPSTKAVKPYHDENISYDRMVAVLREFFAAKGIDLDPEKTAKRLAALSLRIYETAAEYALKRGIIIADTKFEFGLMKKNGRWCIVLVDEVLTADSSRFWDGETYQPGQPQNSLDKQILRNWLEGEIAAKRWNGEYPPPEIDPAVLQLMIDRYREINRRLFG